MVITLYKDQATFSMWKTFCIRCPPHLRKKNLLRVKVPSTYTTKILPVLLCFGPKCWIIELLLLTSSWIWVLVWPSNPSFIPNLIVWIKKVGGNCGLFYETGWVQKIFLKFSFWQGNFFLVFLLRKFNNYVLTIHVPATNQPKAKNGDQHNWK